MVHAAPNLGSEAGAVRAKRGGGGTGMGGGDSASLGAEVPRNEDTKNGARTRGWNNTTTGQKRLTETQCGNRSFFSSRNAVASKSRHLRLSAPRRSGREKGGDDGLRAMGRELQCGRLWRKEKVRWEE